jgi:hypothetical protein
VLTCRFIVRKYTISGQYVGIDINRGKSADIDTRPYFRFGPARFCGRLAIRAVREPVGIFAPSLCFIDNCLDFTHAWKLSRPGAPVLI